MSRRDKIHEAVKVALEKYGWIIQTEGITFKIDLVVWNE